MPAASLAHEMPAPSTRPLDRPLAPSHGDLPTYPASWYLLCKSGDLRSGPLTRRMLGRALVAYRTAAGRAVVMEAHCSHMGADLGRGQVVGENLRCPFHHWQYGPDGRCRHIPSQPSIPAFACQAAYPVAERHGYVFVFAGRRALFPLPFFLGERAEDFVAGPAFRFEANCPWYMLVANGFDTQHFLAVHDRQILGPAVVDCPAPFARRVRYTSRVVGESIHDRLLRCVAGDTVEVSITTWGGPFIAVTAAFRRARGYMIVSAQAQDEQRTLAQVIVFVPRVARLLAGLWRPLALRVRRWLSQGFLLKDVDRLGSARYRPGTLVEADLPVIDYLRWQSSLTAPAEEGCGEASSEARTDR